VSRRSLQRLVPPPAGRNARQDSSSNNNNAINNNSRSSSIKRRITTTTAMATMAVAAVGVAPPTPLPPRVCGPPTSTPGPTPFRCGRVRGGGQRPVASPRSAGYVGWHSFLWSSTTCRAALHITIRASTHSSWSAAGSSTAGYGGVVPMDRLVGSIVTGQLL
jgi:hypothetical protein